MKHFTGIYPALVTPFDESGRVSLGIVTKLIDSLLEKGVSGFYVGGSTGEAHQGGAGTGGEYKEPAPACYPPYQ